MNKKELTILTPLFFAANILVFTPALIYLNNVEQFSLPLFSAMRIACISFVVVFGLLWLVQTCTPRKHAEKIAIVLALISIAFWFQGNVLNWDYGVLDGKSIQWEKYEKLGLVDIVAWVFLIACGVFIARKKPIYIVRAAGFVCCLLFAVTLVSFYENQSYLLIQKSQSEISNFDKIAGFSSKKNVVHIVTDGFQSDVFDELINNADLKEKYDKSFDGFIYYKETLGTFPYTRFAVPAFLAAEVYSNEKSKDEYIDEVLRGETIVKAAVNNQFEVDVVADGGYLLGRYRNLPHDNIFDINDTKEIQNKLSRSALLVDMSLFRSLPGVLKKAIYNDQKWFLKRYFTQEDFLQYRYFTNTFFMRSLVESMSVDREVGVYKYIHIMNAHNPMVVDQSCRYLGGTTATNRATLTYQSKCTMDTLALLLNRMRELGVYDESLIIIHADHGGWVDNYRLGSNIIFPSGQVGPNWIKSLASPLLAIKLPLAHGDIETSEALASLTDIPDTISDIMGWSESFGEKSLLSLKKSDKRERFFRFYSWQKNAWEAEYTGPIIEYAIDGSHYEAEWKPVKILQPPE